ncbi:pectin lyase fold/virulence factor [Zychaea mexicana]|uniref:pectin lyase fold/virulence factor n=1 Tax=Zychaea mexicana TaxID=64656 RepID=UPI0022FE5C8B|nr:pectin lyase fold/virulence factor [Zychaea mexicana]KAI9488243.1 pectin lyase fold/virulence factor [Zychaea mexicana]
MLSKHYLLSLLAISSWFLPSILAASTTVKVSLGDSIQDAINSLPDDDSSAIIEVESGTYNENITISRPNIVFKPSESGQVVLEQSVENYAVVYIESTGENIAFYNFEIINSIGEAAGNQNALRTYGARLAMYNCKLVGFGDTAFFVRGSGYLYNTWVEGKYNLYVYKSTVACSGKGAVTAASTLLDNTAGGFVFNQANFTPVVSSIYDKRQEDDHSYSSPLSPDEYEASTILGRPWHNGPRVIIVHSNIMGHIRPEGWDAWNFSDEELKNNVFYAEYGNTGPGADTSGRVSWSKQISEEEATAYLSAKTYFDNLDLGTDWIDPEYLD